MAECNLNTPSKH